MSKIFNKKTIVEMEVFDESKYEKFLTKEELEEFKKPKYRIIFPRETLKEYLIDININQLEMVTDQLFYDALPHKTICKNCNDCNVIKRPTIEWNCGPAFAEFSVLKALVATNLILLIEINKNLLTKRAKQQLVVLFFTKAFEFKGLKSAYRNGEMAKYLIKEGFQEVSRQLEQIGLDKAKELILKNYYTVKDEIIISKLGGPGYSDYQKVEKKFWKNKQEQYALKKEGPVKETFLSSLTETQLEKIHKRLTEGGFIHKKVSFSIFKIVFSGKKSLSKEKIKWTLLNREGNPHQKAFREFLRFMTSSKLRRNVLNDWFTDANGNPVKLAKSKKNEYSNYYDDLKSIING